MAYPKPKWWNLKQNKCPLCGAFVTQAASGEPITCTKVGCDFRISEEKFNRIVRDTVGKFVDANAISD